MRLKITIDSEKYDKYLLEAPEKVARALQDTIQKASYLVERGAKINSPVDTGRLRSSIATELIPLQATIQPHVNYAMFVHNGTKFLQARPFLYDAGREVERLVSGILNDELEKVL